MVVEDGEQILLGLHLPRILLLGGLWSTETIEDAVVRSS